MNSSLFNSLQASLTNWNLKIESNARAREAAFCRGILETFTNTVIITELFIVYHLFFKINFIANLIRWLF